MASTKPAKGERETDLILAVSQPEVAPTQNTDLENQNLGDEPPTELPSSQNKSGSWCMPIRKPLRYLFICLLCVCLAPVAYAIVTTATIAILPLLLAGFVVVRLIQFAIKTDNFANHIALVAVLRCWIFIAVMLLLVEAGLFYPMAKYVPGLKDVIILGLSITMWIKIICKLIGIYLLSQVVWLCLLFTISELITDKNERALVMEAVSEIITSLLLRWAEVVVMNSVTTFNQSKIIGVYTQKWIRAFLFVFIGHNIIILLTHLFVWSLPKYYGGELEFGKYFLTFLGCNELVNSAFNKRYVVYIAYGIKRSIIFFLTAIMLLFTWLLYMGDYLKTTSEDKKVLEFGTWTLVSVLICAFLWLIKSGILLYWEAHAVYDRLHTKIANIGKQLYFLVLLSHVSDEQNMKEISEVSSGCVFSIPAEKKSFWVLKQSDSEGDEFYETSERKIVRRILMKIVNSKRGDSTNNNGPKVSIYDIQKVAQTFLLAQFTLSKESLSTDLSHLQKDNSEEPDENDVSHLPNNSEEQDEDGISHLPNNNSKENNEFLIEKLKMIIQDEGCPKDWEMFLEMLVPDEHTKKDVQQQQQSPNKEEKLTFQKVKTWMERAHSSCRFITNTLISEKDVVKCLNQVITGLIYVATFMTWLLLTGLAKTNVLVLVASPLLAATFIFGDTCKSLFQGIIYIYVVHPFDVGDLCVIDGNLVEVKKIGVWSTVFSKVRTIGKQHEEIYPNSMLAVKKVINHKTDFDWNDCMEFSLTSPDKERTMILKKEIKNFLDKEKHRFTPGFHSVEFKEIGEKAKIAVHVKHIVRTEGLTCFECLKKKEKRRFKFALDIQTIVNKHEPPKTDTPAETFVWTNQTFTS